MNHATTVRGVDQGKHQRQRRDQLPVFGQVRDHRRVQLIAAYLFFKGNHPLNKQGLRLGAESPDNGVGVGCGLQLCQALKYSPGGLLGWCVWPLIDMDVLAYNVWPDCQTKTL